MREALLRLAASSPGNDAFPFALSLAEAAPAHGRGVALESVSRNELAVTPQVMPGLFTPEECARIVAACARHPLHAGQVVQERENYRLARAAWIPAGDDMRWAYERIAVLVSRLNRWYRYDLFGFVEPLHFIRYEAGGKFDWHLDCGGERTCTRKLSVTVQLTAPQEYEGGALEFCPQGELHRSRHHGAATVFPSMLAHRVTPVSRGVRHAIVAWIHGPSFR
ncbi:MAG TPA: 2OG-Fe(II) oxygenase [Usitatibacter sp.]|nr:2OG-Fe(II) oxygenase [Usitatibacter sp.]